MEYTLRQQMLTLSYLSYLGFGLTLDKTRNEHHIYKLVTDGLSDWKPLENEWEIAWGPAVHRFPFAIFDDNLMYVVKHTLQDDTYAIVIRGTNPIGLWDWLLEDLLVQRLVPWKSDKVSENSNPRISYSTHLGLSTLTELTAAEDLPGEGHTLQDFLKKVVAETSSDKVKVYVTGHSLGGALAPLLTLWLSDRQGTGAECWDPDSCVELSCYAFAGPSPGNSDFSAYYDSQLGDRTERIHNSLDVVPHAWAPSSMKNLLSIYEGTATPSTIMKSAYYFLKFSTSHLDYEQIKPDTPAFVGEINPALKLFDLQMVDQHMMGYLREFGLADELAFDFLKQELTRIYKRIEKRLDKIPLSGV
ncbi:MAG: hypothetical protein R3208_10550 [Ketobacteraceae bacterium]|nr:hypothetical protein [Ketobacteraceae bacterium]